MIMPNNFTKDLLNIPFAALHDGNKYLIQRYTLAITPGWQLTDPRKFKRDKIQALLNGLAIQSKNDKNFPPLENASIELENIYNWLGSGDTLIETENYKDPYFWAPFILIGNWL
jgi:CHAT domain-containing protein